MLNAVFIIIGLALLTLIGWIAKSFFLAAEISIFIRVLVGVVVVGMVTLLGIVIRDRIIQTKKEDFKGIDK